MLDERGRLFWILILLTPLSILLLPNLVCNNTPSARAQQDNTNFHTYVNTDLGFTIKYPSDWTADESHIGDGTIAFRSPDRSGFVVAGVSNLKPNETGIMSPQNLTNLSRQIIIPHLQVPGQRLIEVNTNGYFLSGHPAIRVIMINSFGGPGEPGATQGIQPHDVKSMMLGTIVGGKKYGVGYGALPESFPTYLQTAQAMIDSFQIIIRQ